MESIGADLEVMKRVPLADEHVTAMCAIGHERVYHKGEMVAEIGKPHDTFVYVIEGEIEVVDPFSGERLLESSLGRLNSWATFHFSTRRIFFQCERQWTRGSSRFRVRTCSI